MSRTKGRTATTLEIARQGQCHPNTVRLYEAWGYLPPIPRARNGYRRYSPNHLRLMILARTAFPGPYPGGGGVVHRLVRAAAENRLGEAFRWARLYRAVVSRETQKANAVLSTLERWARKAKSLSGRPVVYSRIAAAKTSGITIDSLRTWERNGLLQVGKNRYGYCEYSPQDLARISIIRALSVAGYSLAAIHNMFLKYDRGQIRQLSKKTLAVILNTPAPDAPIVYVTDRWLTVLAEHKLRAGKIIQLLTAMKRPAPLFFNDHRNKGSVVRQRKPAS